MTDRRCSGDRAPASRSRRARRCGCRPCRHRRPPAHRAARGLLAPVRGANVCASMWRRTVPASSPTASGSSSYRRCASRSASSAPSTAALARRCRACHSSLSCGSTSCAAMNRSSASSCIEAAGPAINSRSSAAAACAAPSAGAARRHAARVRSVGSNGAACASADSRASDDSRSHPPKCFTSRSSSSAAVTSSRVTGRPSAPNRQLGDASRSTIDPRVASAIAKENTRSSAAAKGSAASGSESSAWYGTSASAKTWRPRYKYGSGRWKTTARRSSVPGFRFTSRATSTSSSSRSRHTNHRTGSAPSAGCGHASTGSADGEPARTSSMPGKRS